MLNIINNRPTLYYKDSRKTEIAGKALAIKNISYICVKFVYYIRITEISMQDMRPIQIDETITAQTLPIKEHAQIQNYRLSYYELGRYLGRCLLGDRFEARKYRSVFQQNLGVPFVLKIITAEESSLAQSAYFNEVNTLELLKEKDLTAFVRCLNHWKHDNKFYIALERSRYGSLKGFIEHLLLRKQKLNESEITYLLRQILKALQVLHQNQVIHGNLKPENIEIGDNLNIKLSDFSLSNLNKQESLIDYKNSGTLNYQAPEFIHQKAASASFAGDIWSIGLILYFLIYQKHPINAKDTKDFKKKLKAFLDFSIKSDFNHIFLKTMALKANEREGVKQLLENQIFNKIVDENAIKSELTKRFDEYLSETKKHEYSWKRQVNYQPIKHTVGIMNIINTRLHTKVIITKLIKLNKFGYFMLLSNMNVIAYFNSHAILKFSNSLLKSASTNEQKILVWVYRQHFKTIIQQSSWNTQTMFMEPNCTIKKIIRLQDSFLIRLTNNAIQLFSIDKLAQKSDKSFNQDFLTFSKSISFNYSNMNPSQITLRSQDKCFVSQNFEKALASSHKTYFQYIGTVFKTIVQNSIISG